MGTENSVSMEMITFLGFDLFFVYSNLKYRHDPKQLFRFTALARGQLFVIKYIYS